MAAKDLRPRFPFTILYVLQEVLHTMPKYKAAARRDIWYDDEDTAIAPNYNPFRKIHRR